MTLSDWLKNQWLKSHKTSPEEIKQLFQIAERDLQDASVSEISLDWRLAMAYNASLRYATIALNVLGYRTAGEGHHERLIESLRYTISAEPDVMAQLQSFRKKRNVSSYDVAGTVSQYEVDQAIQLARELSGLVKDWLKKKYPELIL
jgi:HEPN domain-containing protein